MMSSECTKDLRNVVTVFGFAPGVDEDIIYINDHEAMQELPEDLMNEVLKHGRGVDQTIGHNQIFVVACRGHKSGFPFIPFSYSHQVIGAAEVQLREDGSCTELFKGRRDERKGIFELDGALLSVR